MKKSVFILFFLLIAPVDAANIDSLIALDDEGNWTLTLVAQQPVKRMVFKRNPDTSRVLRWKPLSSAFGIKVEAKEIIERLDKKKFTQVQFKLTPTYVGFAKEYAPFTPFSDKSILLHSGRFFVCAEHCSPQTTSWKIQIRVPRGMHIVAGKKIHKSQATLHEKDDGTKIYVGKAKPAESPFFISLIDSRLPPLLRKKLQTLPEISKYFAKKMGRLDYKPMLFASYHDTDDGSYGYQGGTLPGQIFLHWYGEQSIESVNVDEIFWFIAHEIAHLYQKMAAKTVKKENHWLHEGSADYFASLATKEMDAGNPVRQKKIEHAKRYCIDNLTKNSSYIQSSINNPKLHYACGFVLFKKFAIELKSKQSMDVFGLWRLYNKEVESGKPATVETFLDTSKPFLSSDMYNGIKRFSKETNYDAATFFTNITNSLADN